MKTSTKLTLGFGALIVLFILTEIAVIVPLQSIDEQIKAMVDVGRPLRLAARNLESDVLAYALSVRTYAQSGEPRFQKEADAEAEKIDANLADYTRLAETERQQKLAADFVPRWQQLREKGDAILYGGDRFYSDEEWHQFTESRIALATLARDQMMPDALENYDNRREMAVGKVDMIQRFVIILFILSVVIAIVMSQAVSKTILRSETEIQSRREHLRATLTSIADAVVTTDLEGKVTSLNLAAEHLTGWKQDEANGKLLVSVVRFIDEATGDEAESPALKALREGTVVSSDSVLLVTRYDTHVPIEDHAAPILSPKGETVGSVLVFRDVTERRLHARELEKSYEELDVRVKHRTYELAETHAELVREMGEHAIAEQKRIELLGRLVSGQEDERRRIARDLHDQLGQRLTALRLKIASLKDAVGEDEVLKPKIDRLQAIALRLDAEVSYLAWELRPSALDDLGFAAAVGVFVKEWSRQFEIAADFQSAKIPKRRLKTDVETHLYRITQEALNNIAKHAAAKQVSVVLEKRGDRIILIIEDDGKGFDPAKLKGIDRSGRGLGLLGMRERATLIGGELEIESATGRGTTIYVRVPLEAVEKKATV